MALCAASCSGWLWWWSYNRRQPGGKDGVYTDGLGRNRNPIMHLSRLGLKSCNKGANQALGVSLTSAFFCCLALLDIRFPSYLAIVCAPYESIRETTSRPLEMPCYPLAHSADEMESNIAKAAMSSIQ